MLFVRTCPGCEARGGRTIPCCGCRRSLAAGAASEVESPACIDRLVALHLYEGVARPLVLAAKNGGRRSLLRRWGVELASLGACLGPFDAVTWVPASRRGARSRGYDQGRLLARSAAATIDRPARRLLVRRPGPNRVGSDRADRLGGPDLRCPVDSPNAILLIDDVVTTGSSMSAAARALRAAGAARVVGLVVAVAGSDPRIRPFSPDDQRAQQQYG